MRVVICDDDKSCIDDIYTNIQSIMTENNISAQINTFTDSEELFECGNHYDLAFLDVEMKPFSGIETARKLKTINKNIVIFFITSFDKYLDEAMDINAFRFIKKPIDVKRLRSGLLKALTLIDNTQVSFHLKEDNSIVTVSSNDIIYIEIVGRSTEVVLENKKYISANKIDFWESKLVASFFYRVHKSYIINMKYITQYSRDMVTLAQKYNIPISYRKQVAFRTAFFDSIGG
ncbi:MAG: LytTR family DNA-binding domain-containing protein [Clostridia bacterium]|nr:LytTR family DNA-binding domain-containing protein [Clostridia bacterium]